MSEFLDISKVKMPNGLPKINFYKKRKNYEIEVSLFEACNLNCKFCFEKHDNYVVDTNYIRNLPYLLIEETRDKIKEYNVEYVCLRLWGGELFFDKLSDDVFDSYRDFLSLFKELMTKDFPSIKVDASFLSNGVFTKRERVKQLLDDTNTQISFSYDPVDRFNTENQKELWYSNLLYFKSYINTISITLTSRTAQAYMNGDKYFELIPDDIKIDVNYYTANKDYELYQLTDEIIYDFFKWLVDNNKFNVFICYNMFRYLIPEQQTQVSRYCDCKCATQLTNGHCTTNCAKRAFHTPIEKFYQEYTSYVTEDNCSEVKNSMGLLKRGCLYCEHYTYCPMMCWVAVIFEGFKPTVCPFQRIYKYITQEKIEQFKEWQSTHDIHRNIVA